MSAEATRESLALNQNVPKALDGSLEGLFEPADRDEIQKKGMFWDLCQITSKAYVGNIPEFFLTGFEIRCLLLMRFDSSKPGQMSDGS